jgi:hypothetical protein
LRRSKAVIQEQNGAIIISVTNNSTNGLIHGTTGLQLIPAITREHIRSTFGSKIVVVLLQQSSKEKNKKKRNFRTVTWRFKEMPSSFMFGNGIETAKIPRALASEKSIPSES